MADFTGLKAFLRGYRSYIGPTQIGAACLAAVDEIEDLEKRLKAQTEETKKLEHEIEELKKLFFGERY